MRSLWSSSSSSSSSARTVLVDGTKVGISNTLSFCSSQALSRHLTWPAKLFILGLIPFPRSSSQFHPLPVTSSLSSSPLLLAFHHHRGWLLTCLTSPSTSTLWAFNDPKTAESQPTLCRARRLIPRRLWSSSHMSGRDLPNTTHPN